MIRKLPQDIDAEKAVLGAIMVDNEAMDIISSILKPTDFYTSRHQVIYKAALKISGNHIEVDVISMNAELKGTDIDIDYLSDLVKNLVTAANVDYYAKIVSDKSIKRQRIRLATELIESEYGEESNIHDIINKIDNIGRIEANYETPRALASQTLDIIDDISKGNIERLGIKTGYQDIDRYLGGLPPGEVSIIAGATSCGKTAFAINLLRKICVDRNRTGIMFSFEMKNQYLFLRLLCSQSQIDYNTISGGMNDEIWKEINDTANELANKKLYFFEDMDIGVWDIFTKSKQILKLEKKIDVIIIDHINLIHEKDKFNNRNQELDFVSRQLKNIAKKLNVPIIVIAQLNRSFEMRRPPKPRLSDLRDSGSLEQIANKVLLLYRPGLYYETEEQESMKVIVAKNRDGGMTGEIDMHFEGKTMRFYQTDRTGMKYD